jgi:putative methylase
MDEPNRSSKRQLEIRLGELDILSDPKLKLEQYPVSPEVASELLYMAGFEHEDLERRVVDLGTGTGRLAIGAVLMGAEEVIGVDVDPRAIAIAVENAAKVGVRVQWVVGDIEALGKRFDTVVMNPPYGTRSPHKDVSFLLRAFELAPTVYSIHKSSTRDYLVSLVERQGRRVDEVRSMKMRIPRSFEFHTKKWRNIDVDLYRITS